MSQENLEVVRGMYDAFYAGNANGALSYFDAEVLVDTGSARPDLSVGKGREYLAAVVGTWAATWDGWRDEVAEMRDLGSRVLVISVQRGKGKGSGLDVEARYAILYDVANGAIVSVRMYGTVAEALEAAGLSE
jgi:ketosteroid isomerase-like protein